MIKSTIDTLTSQSRKVNNIVNITKQFIEWTNDNMNIIDNIVYKIEENFPVKWIKKKKKMSDENGDYETLIFPTKEFEITVRNVIYDEIINSS